jgi:hypothetical protein
MKNKLMNREAISKKWENKLRPARNEMKFSTVEKGINEKKGKQKIK